MSIVFSNILLCKYRLNRTKKKEEEIIVVLTQSYAIVKQINVAFKSIHSKIHITNIPKI